MWRKTLIVTLFAFVLIGVLPVLHASEAYTDVYVDPPTKDVFGLETEFTVDLSITNASDVCGWEFKLYYSNAVLNATLLAEGPFLASAGSTYLYVNTFTDTYNTTHGLIHAACTLIGPGPGADGNGTLTTLTFKTKNPGDTPLTLQDTIIIDSNENPIPHTTHHATIHVRATPLEGDLNGDGIVDMKDIGIATRAFGSTPGHPRWNPVADVNHDLKVDMKDIGIVIKHFGESIP